MISFQAPARAQIEISVARVTRSLEKMDKRLEASADVVRKYTAQRFEARGFGEWPELAPATIQAKERTGADDPERQLFETGGLMDAITTPGGSGTTPDGPSGWQVVDSSPGGFSRVAFGVDWDNGGWQIPVLLDAGDGVRLPARPIWPTGSEADRMKAEIADVLRGKVVP